MTYELHWLDKETGIYLIKEDPGLSEQIRKRGVHEPWLVNTLKRELSENMIGLDIGANLGFFALLEASLCRQVYAIEPVPENYTAMNKTMYFNRVENVSMHPIAIGNKDAMTEMKVTKQSNWGTLVQDGSKFFDDFYRANETGTIKVHEVPLDAWLGFMKFPVPDFIRMDVEGYEHEIIEGAAKTLGSMGEGSLLFIEFHNKGLKDFQTKVAKTLTRLEESGFSPFAAYGKMGREMGKSLDISGDFIGRFSNMDTASWHGYFKKSNSNH